MLVLQGLLLQTLDVLPALSVTTIYITNCLFVLAHFFVAWFAVGVLDQSLYSVPISDNLYTTFVGSTPE